MKIVKKIKTINQKWYATLFVAILINLGWNYSNSRISVKQGLRITDLETQNLALKKTNVELLSKNFLGQRILDQLPFAIWKKKLENGSFKMKFLNNTAKVQFLSDKGLDRYYYHNKTDFDVFPYSEAIKFHREDSIVAYAKTDTIAHFNTDFYTATGKKLIQDGYTRWREIVDNDTTIWGKMDRFYIKQDKR